MGILSWLCFLPAVSCFSVTRNLPCDAYTIDKLVSNTWVPLCRESEVPRHRKKPLTVNFGGNRVSVVNLPEGIFAFDDLCPHRGACIGEGSRSGPHVTCPYHGMSFDVRTGRVSSFLNDFGFEKLGIRLERYPTRLHDGLVWTNTSPDPKEFVNRLPENRKGMRSIYGSVDVKTSVFNLAENLLCPIHISVVHKFGNSVSPKPMDIFNDPSKRSSFFRYKSGDRSLSAFMNTDGDRKYVEVVNSFSEPFSMESSVLFGPDLEFLKNVRVHLLPIDSNTTRMHWGLHRNFAMHGFLDECFRYMMVDTIGEDKWILSKISGASEGRRQFLNEFDWTIVQYRKRVVDLFKNI